MRATDLSRCSYAELLEIGSEDAQAFGVLFDRHEERTRRHLGMEPRILSDDHRERIDELRAAAPLDSLSLLDALPVEQRTAVRGRVIDGRDYDELAREFNCSELVVRQRVSRGLRALRSLAGYRS